MTVNLTLNNIDDKMLDIIKSVVNLRQGSSVDIEEIYTEKFVKNMKECEEEFKSGKFEKYKTFEEYKKAMNSLDG